MKRVIIIFLWLAVFFVPPNNSYCKHGLTDMPGRSTEFSVFEENGKVGLKDANDQILIPASYDAIGWSNGNLSIVDEVVGYKAKGLWGLIQISNKPVTPAGFLELIPGEGSFLIAKKKSELSQRPSYGIINTSGKTIIPFSYDALTLSNMRAVVISRSANRFNYGLIDPSNKILIPVQYQRVYSIGSLRYAVENFENKTAIFSDEGKQITNFLIDSISSFKKEHAIVYQNQRQGLIDRNGKMKIEPRYREIICHDDGSIQARQMDSWFLLDGKNNLINQINADSVRSLTPDHYALQVSGKHQLTNNSFTPLHENYFSTLRSFQKGKAVFKISDKAGLINRDGKIMLDGRFNELIMDQHYLRARLNTGYKNRWMILDSTGNNLTEKPYEFIGPFNGKIFPVRNRNYWGAVNALGKEIVACVHDSLIQQTDNYIVVRFKGKYGIINLHENWIITPQPNTLRLLDDAYYFEFAGKTTFLKSLTGKIIYFSDNRLEYKSNHVLEHLSSGAFWMIDMNGIIIDRSYHPQNVEKIFHESEGYRAIRKDGKYGFIDDQGRLRIANRYDDARRFSNGLAAIKIRSKWGFIDDQERLVVQPVFDQVERFNNGYAIVSQNNFFGLIDKSGKLILPCRYDEIVVNGENRFLLKQNGLFGMAAADGTLIINPKYDTLLDLSNGFVIIQRGGKYGLLTLQGLSTIPMIYDGLSFDSHHAQYLGVKKSAWEVFERSPQSTVNSPR